MKNMIVTQYQMKRAERKKWLIATLVILLAFSALVGTFCATRPGTFAKAADNNSQIQLNQLFPKEAEHLDTFSYQYSDEEFHVSQEYYTTTLKNVYRAPYSVSLDIFKNLQEGKSFFTYKNVEYFYRGNAKNKTVYIIRYDVSEEHLLEASIWGNDPGGYCSANNAIYLGLDVIWLKFFNDVNYKVIGVVSDPIDVFSAVSPPPYSRWTGNKLKDALTATTRKIVLSVFGIIVTAFSVLLFTGLFKGFISRIDNIAIKVSFSVITLLLCVALSFAIVFFVSVFIYGKVKNIDFDNAMYVFWRILWPLKGGNL